MQFSDPNANLFGDGAPYNSPYGNSGRGLRRRRGRGCLGCLASIVIILAISALISYGFGLAIHVGPTTIQVGTNPTLVIESVSNPHSQIYVHAGASNGQISIQPVRVLNLPFGLAESYQETSDHQTVIYDLGTDTSGTFDITVPAQTNLKINANDAAILVHGITGQMHLETNDGVLIVKNSTIVGPSLLRSNSGEVQVTQDHLSGSVTVDNNSAGITFQSTLDPAGTYRFTNNSGQITLTLPQSAAAQINAQTNSGSINNAIPGAKVQKLASGFALQASIGASPRAQLTLYSNDGTITVNEQGGV
jgi:hypothetical protein